MLGVIVNVFAVLIGGTIGLILKKGIPQNISDIVMQGIGLCTLYIGISGTMEGKNTLVVILSMVIGAAVGQGLNLDDRLHRFADRLEGQFKKEDQKTSIAEGFITASLLFCVGAMTIVGSLQAGLVGDNEMLFTKSTLDFVSALIFASTLGIGVLLSSGFVLIFQGSIVLLADYVSPYLNTYVISEMTCVGSLLIIALGSNLLNITNIKVMNFLPAIFIPILLCMFM